jgi:hypothetical protein
MRIIYDNEIDDLTATNLTALTEAGGYEITNVQNQRLGKVWKSDSTSTQTVVCNFTGDVPGVKVAAIAGHNITSSTTVLIQANSADSWAAPSVSTSITVLSDKVMLKFFDTAQSFAYWRFSFDEGDLEIGRLWLGDYITIDPASTTNFSVSKKRNDDVTYGKMRQKFSSVGIGWREFDLSFPVTGQTGIDKILTMFDTIGNHSSVIFCNFDTSRDYEIVDPCYCSVDGDVDFDHEGSQKYTYKLKLSEDK